MNYTFLLLHLDHKDTLRVGGRLRNACIPAAAKNQLILPKDHFVTRLLVNQINLENGYVSPKHVLADLRERYWVVNGRTFVRYLSRRCFLCKIKRAKKRYSRMADLPFGRSAWVELAFTNCSVDIFGPVLIKPGWNQLKCWGIIYTCVMSVV